MANSRQRRKNKRANKRAIRKRLWFIAEHPLLASGAGAMLLAGIGTEISGWPGLAAVFYFAALLLLIVVFGRADLFRVSPITAWVTLGLSAILVTVLWLKLQPPHKSERPDLVVTVHQAKLMKGKLHPDNVVLFVWLTVVNNGSAPSVAKDWNLIVQVPQKGAVRVEPVNYTGLFEYEAGGAYMRLDISRESLIDRAMAQPIPANGGRVAGILSFVLPERDIENLPVTGVPMLLLYRDISETRYSARIPFSRITEGPPLKIPGIGFGEVIGPVVPSPTPRKKTEK